MVIKVTFKFLKIVLTGKQEVRIVFHSREAREKKLLDYNIQLDLSVLIGK